MMSWLIGLVSFTVTCTFAPAIRALLVKHDLLDRPNVRSSHTIPIPRGGGLSCLLGIVAAALAGVVAGTDIPWPVLGAALSLAILGLVDDRFDLPAVPRLAIQILVGALLGTSIGGVAWALIGAAIFPLILNVVNFMDGINGISAITLGLWGITVTGLAVHYGSATLTFLGAATAGAAIGFLPWNAPRARMFLGDAGSYLFGALAAGGIIEGVSTGAPLLLLMAPFSVYLLDATTTLLRRAVRRRPLTQGHRDHIYQRLVDRVGLPHLLVSGWTGLIALTVVVLANSAQHWWQAGGITALLIVYLLSVPLWRTLRTAGLRFSGGGRGTS